MTPFIVFVGLAVIVLVMVMQYAQAQQERKVWNEFAQDDFKAFALQRPLTPNAVAKADGVKSSPGARAERQREVVVVRIEDESPDCRSFYLSSTDKTPLPPFYGGQYLVVSLPDPQSPGHSISRCYSLSDGVSDSSYRITVKRVPGGRMSGLLHDTVRAGDRLRVQLPSGRFHIGNQSVRDDAGRPRPLNLIAAGIGITPMLSMLRECLSNTPERPVRLFYQLRDASNSPFLSELRQLAKAHAKSFRLFVAFSKPRPGDLMKGDMQGRMDSIAILGAAGTTAGNFMICGPEEFMQAIAIGLIKRGVPQESVEYESFVPTGKPKSKPETHDKAERLTKESRFSSPSTVTTQIAVRFNKSECDVVWANDDSSLLDIAERCGVTIESACRSGQCGSCIVRLLAGHVRYAESPGYEGLESNEALACIAQPTGHLVIDA